MASKRILRGHRLFKCHSALWCGNGFKFEAGANKLAHHFKETIPFVLYIYQYWLTCFSSTWSCSVSPDDLCEGIATVLEFSKAWRVKPWESQLVVTLSYRYGSNCGPKKNMLNGRQTNNRGPVNFKPYECHLSRGSCPELESATELMPPLLGTASSNQLRMRLAPSLAQAHFS